MKRAKVIHHVLLVLMVVSIGPLGFYGYQLIQLNRDKLQTQEQLAQFGIAQSLARPISLYLSNARDQVDGFLASSLDLSSGNDLELEGNRGLEKKLEEFVGRSKNLLNLNIVNDKGSGIQAGEYNVNDEGMTKRFLAKAFQSASQNQTSYFSEPLTIEVGKETKPVIIMSSPIRSGDKGFGAVTVILKLDDIIHWVSESSTARKTVYVVDFNGQIVVHPDHKKMPAGMDLSRVEIVGAFKDEWRKSKGARLQPRLQPFKLQEGDVEKQMLGTFFAVTEAPWGVIVQIDQRDAFATVAEMKAETIRWGVLMLLMAGGVGLLSAQAITNPIRQLAESAKLIARGDFSKKIQIRSRTEIGELAETFNKMTDDLELYIQQIRKASEENKALFLGTIRALAAAVDEKDPYTRGHSDRVTKYSVIIARALALDERTIEIISISALLHDVGKIGIDDKILKKPGFLTPEEFEIMKQHPVKGFNIMKTIEQMRNVLPGLRSHHEQWDGNGYPDHLKSEEIPLIARIIAVADTLDAMTTNRPYQQALTFEFAVEKINKNVGVKYDKSVVAAFNRAIEKGDLMVDCTVPEALAI
ncbi:MAG TPA: HD domain-containing phosphohydrolase [Terriglobia bacterium]|nr:HD domain-containing phosphohydrolase [Terriglobia bacterium]